MQDKMRMPDIMLKKVLCNIIFAALMSSVKRESHRKEYLVLLNVCTLVHCMNITAYLTNMLLICIWISRFSWNFIMHRCFKHQDFLLCLYLLKETISPQMIYLCWLLADFGYFSVLPFTFLVNMKREGKKVSCLETVKMGLGDKVLVVKAKSINPEQMFFQL